MRWNKSLIPTLKEEPADAEVISHKLMLRAGLIRQLSAGLYTFLPLGWGAMLKIMQIIRDEMNAIGGQEIFMPALNPIEIWRETGRAEDMAEIMLQFTDRKGRETCLAPTHEEIITDIARNEIRSFRDLPQTWYQIQNKFRDEPRPRFGLLRVREFIMKDSYTLCSSWNELDTEYLKHDYAYRRIFTRCGLEYIVVGASSGLMGGSASQEFMVPSDAGEDKIVFCDQCGYSANMEIAKSVPNEVKFVEITEQKKVHTPNLRTVSEVSQFLGLPEHQMLKSLIYVSESDGKPFMVLIRGDHQLNEEKLAQFVGSVVRPAEPEEVIQWFGVPVGFLGPLNTPENLRIFLDESVPDDEEIKFASGANEIDYHIVGFTVGDIRIDERGDFRLVSDGEGCPECGKKLSIRTTIEVGHIFKLGTKYSEAMGATFLDDQGKQNPIIMGSYGIGVGRILASAIELYSDDDGIVLPITIAPFEVIITALDVTKPEVVRVADKLYEELRGKNIDVLYDDRDERAGVKFKDADLIGIPIRITVGRKVADDIVEIVLRRDHSTQEVNVASAVDKVIELKEMLDNEIFEKLDKIERKWE
ncbi:proline--tRNA ligase [bacterium]|nr:MAG: proline--tRNA ligase [bacterium]